MANSMDKYREWLMGMMIEFGVGNEIPMNRLHTSGSYLHRASYYNHVGRWEIMIESIKLYHYINVITPSAKAYLEKHYDN
jgi:hypothetical protein